MKTLSATRQLRRQNMARAYMLTAFAVIAVFVLMELLGTGSSVTSAAACVVDSTGDTGSGSLRSNVSTALSGGCDDNTITFDPGLSNQTITLATPIDIEVAGNGTVNIVSDVPVIVSGGGITRPFRIGFGETVLMQGFTIDNGVVEQTDRPVASLNFNWGKGGGIVLEDSVSLTIREMTFSNNSAFVGGAIFNRGTSELEIFDTTFDSNTSVSDGGAISSSGGNLNIESSTFVSNLSGASGGAIKHFSSTSQSSMVKNSTFTLNSGKQGILYYDGLAASVVNSTINDNTVRIGAIYSDFGADVTVSNSIIYDIKKDASSGNLAEGGACAAASAGTFNVASTNNIVAFDNTLCQASAVSTDDPILGPLADNGGPTQTMEPASGSPAIGNADAGVCPTTDQRGVSRPQPADGACDVGAVEVAVRDFDITKSTNSVFIPGRTYTYNIEVTNTSGASATDVVVVDQLDSNLIYVANSISGPGADASVLPELKWEIGTLAANASVSLSYEVEVDLLAGEGTEIPNTAELTTSSPASQAVFTATTSTFVGSLFADIDLQGKGQSIANGDLEPSLADGTDLGVADVDSAAAVVQTFTISNVGTIDLNLTDSPNVIISGSEFFTVSAQPASSVIPSEGAETFNITFAPTARGLFEANVAIESDDPDEAVYLFKIAGTGCVNTINVTTNADTGAGSLREAVQQICEGGTIDFDPGLSGQTIELTSAQLLLNKDMTIQTAVPVIISGLSVNRIFELSDADVTIDGLHLFRGSASNGADGQGGAIYSDAESSLTVRNTTISASSADLGGAIWSEGALTMANSTLSGNSAAIRGGGLVNAGTGALNNVTIYENNAPNAAGIENVGTFRMDNSIIASGSDGEDCITSSAFASNLNNLIEDNSCAPALSGDPQLSDLRLGGGNSTSPTHAPIQGSPVINAGINDFCEGTDQRGVPRPQPVDSTCDIGAHEVQTTDIVLTKTGSVSAISSGDTMSYTIQVENLGAGPAFDIVVADTLVAELTYGEGSIAGGDSQDASDPTNLTWTIDVLDAGESVMLEFAALIDEGLSDGTTITNSASATTSTPDTNAGNNSSTFIFTIDNSIPILSTQPTIGFGETTFSSKEGDGSVNIEVTLSKKVGYTVSAMVRVTNRVELDVDAATEGMIPVIFSPNEDSKTIEVAIPQDLFYEGVRAVDLEITDVTNAKISVSSFATLEVSDDDAAPLLSVADVSADETNAQTTFDFPVTLDQAAAVTITVDYAVASKTATVGEDLQGTSGVLTIPPGNTSATISIIVLGDTEAETNETFELILSNAVNADEFDFNAEGTIINDDGPANNLYLPFIQDNTN
ncbi:MAG: choice-of-anchor Q domain-containing protein [Chloroflexota bacterium]